MEIPHLRIFRDRHRHRVSDVLFHQERTRHHSHRVRGHVVAVAEHPVGGGRSIESSPGARGGQSTLPGGRPFLLAGVLCVGIDQAIERADP